MTYRGGYGPSSDAVRAGRTVEDATPPRPARRRLWSYADIARHTHVRPATVRSYRTRGLLPEPDTYLRSDQPRWYAETITTWHAARPGRGARTDLTSRRRSK